MSEAFLTSHIGVLLFWCFLLFPWMTVLIFHAARIHMPGRRYLIFPVSLLLILLYNALLYVLRSTDKAFSSHVILMKIMSVRALIVVLVLVTCYMLFLQYYIRTREKRNVTPLTIKEAVDTLPVGLAFYEDSGLVRLSNTEINSLAATLTGHSLRNGNEFWDSLTENDDRNVHELADGTMLISLKDGVTYVLKRDSILLEGSRIRTLSAHDVTREYTLNLELEQKKAMVSEFNHRLKDLESHITAMTIEKEILESKIRVHDGWAGCLMRAKQYLEDKGTVTAEEVLSSWKNNIFQHEAAKKEENISSRYDEILESAKVLGIKINISGHLPENERIAKIVLQAMTTCLSNTACHTDGTNLLIDVQESAENVLIRFTDDGTAAVKEIRESGGLLNLRRSVERMGGDMTIECDPRFALSIELGVLNAV